jgi:ketosteroid isomerase-like protein
MRFLSVLAAALIISAPAFASEKTDAAAPVHQFIDGMNKNNMKAAAAAYAPDASIIDEFPPHYWHGADAFGDWGKDFGTDSQKNGITDPIVTLGKVRHIDVTGDHAYAIYPATYSYKQHGKPVHERGATMTFALQKLADGWKIAAWSWTRP